MNYVLALGNDPNQLIGTVNSLIQQGFKPQGGVSVCTVLLPQNNGNATFIYAQAMIK